MAQLMGLQYGTGCAGTNTSPFDYGCHTGISCSMRNGSTSMTSPNDGDSKSEFGGDCDGVLDLSISPKKTITKPRAKRLPKETAFVVQSISQMVASEDKEIICYTCGKV